MGSGTTNGRGRDGARSAPAGAPRAAFASLPLPATARAVAARPALWPTAVRQLFRLAPRGWWRQPPHLPLPDENWLRFRLQTMYGSAAHDLDPDDLVAWLAWCRRSPQAGGRFVPCVKAGASGPPGVA